MSRPSYLSNIASTTSGTKGKSKAVEDDWEAAYSDDEDDSREGTSVDVDDNVKLWNAPQSTRYELLPRPSSTSCSSTPPQLANSNIATRLPPSQVIFDNLNPKLTILKRPTRSNRGGGAERNSSDGSGGAKEGKTLKQRELEYLEARRRLFGETSTNTPSNVQTQETVRVEGIVNEVAGIELGSDSDKRSESASITSKKMRQKSADSGESRTAGVTRQPKGPSRETGGFGFESILLKGSGERNRIHSGRGRGRSVR